MAGIPAVLITANVGSIFEEPNVMLKVWTEEFLSTITRLDPKFIALHCQEVGGKNYEESMKHVDNFVRVLMTSEELRLFDKVRVFLDEDFSSAQHFTALGSFYFVHDSLKDVLLWDFKECKFLPVNGKESHSGNIESVTTKEKAKFPREFFPECKWSRKGFLRTRWSISGTIFDLINIHLFHDASNLIAMETFPSAYSKTRRRALEHTLDRFHNDQYPNVPYFLFGDLNFRMDTGAVIKKLTEDTKEVQIMAKGNISKLQFRNNDDDLILTIGKKEFIHHEHQNVFTKNGGQWLREYDRELEDFNGRIFEFPIKFIPSYPFEEDVQAGSNYMQTRVPSWCDRILLSPTAKALIQNIQSNEVEYGIMGPTKCMGDHKPIYLRVLLTSDAGMINCCNLMKAPEFCFQLSDNYSELLSMLPDSCASTRADCSSNLLHAASIKHDSDSKDDSSIGSIPGLDLESITLEQINNKIEKQDSENPEKININNPREYNFQIWSNTENRNRNSDISWKNIKFLDTSAWVQGKDNHLNNSQELISNLTIPLIEVTNPSSKGSNDDSDQLNDKPNVNSMQQFSVQFDTETIINEDYLQKKDENKLNQSVEKLDEISITDNTISEVFKTSEQSKVLKPKNEIKECDINVIQENPDLPTDDEIQILNTTSNSQNQNSTDIAEKDKTKKNPFNKVTERCKRSIINDQRGCKKCCCVIS